jgi:hypothetical protein
MSYLEIATAGTGVARDAHYVIPTGGTLPIRTLLLEPQRTNLCIRSEEFDTWTDSNTCNVSADAIAAPDGATTADLLTSTQIASLRRRSITFTADGEKCVAVFLKAGTSGRTVIRLRDGTAVVDRHQVRVTWTAGVPALSTATGAGTLYPVEALANGWYRILFSATGIVAANTNLFDVFPDDLAGTGTVYAWGAQAENAVVPSSYIPTTTATVTRNADSLYFPFTAPPQAMTVYVRGVEQARPSSASPVDLGIVYIGSGTSGVDPRFLMRRSTSGAGYLVSHDNGVTPTSTGLVGAAAVRGDLIELRTVLASSGAVTIGASINNGAEATNGPSAAQALQAAWAGERIYLNSEASAGVGQFAFTHVVVTTGEQTMDTMRQLAGVA